MRRSVAELPLWGVCAIGAALLVSCHRGYLRSDDTLTSTKLTPSADELFEVALYQAGRGDFLRAEQYLTAARDQGYDERQVVYWLVRVCVSSGRYHSALRHASAYLRKSPGDWGLRLVVASIREALGDFAQAQVDLERVVEAQPEHALSRYRLAMLYRQRGHARRQAIPHLRAYLELAPNGPHAGEVRELVLAGSEPSEP